MQITEQKLKQIIREELNEALDSAVPIVLLTAIAATALGTVASNVIDDLKSRYRKSKEKEKQLKVMAAHNEQLGNLLEILKKDRTMRRLIIEKNFKDAVVHARALLAKNGIREPTGISVAIKSIKDIFY